MTQDEPSSPATDSTEPGRPQSDRQLDARTLTCPEPLMLVRNAIRELESGQVLYVQATDPSTVRDLANFCHFLGHSMVDQSAYENDFEFWIRKA